MKSNSNGEPAYSYTINSKTSIGTVAIKVSSLEQSSLFYQNVLGLQQLARSRFDTTLGVDDTPLIHLTEIPDAKPKPRNSTGLYHLGILLPIRRDLARFLTHLLSIRYPLEGAADHVVSESLFFYDPVIIVIEVYSDLHREEWSLIDESENLRTNPLNAEELLSLVKKSTPPWRKAPGNTRIGHVHLLVNDLEAAEWF
ncbi:MAG: VOC family protein [Calditrichota bacterium]